MKQAVEVVHLVGGGPVTATTLSLRRERSAALWAFLVVWLGYAVTVAMASLLGQRLGRVMYLPGVTAAWLLLATGVSLVAARRARRRAQRFALGTRLDADAFCETAVDWFGVARRASSSD